MNCTGSGQTAPSLHWGSSHLWGATAGKRKGPNDTFVGLGQTCSWASLFDNLHASSGKTCPLDLVASIGVPKEFSFSHPNATPALVLHSEKQLYPERGASFIKESMH